MEKVKVFSVSRPLTPARLISFALSFVLPFAIVSLVVSLAVSLVVPVGIAASAVSIDVTALQAYAAFDEAKIGIYATDIEGRPVTGGSGEVTVILPDNAVFVDKEPIKELGNGQYYFTFSTPDKRGTYTALVNFNSGAGSASKSLSFFVSSFDWFGILINAAWVIFIVVSVMFGQKLIIYQVIAKGERFVDALERMTAKGKAHVMRRIPKSKNAKEQINNFLDFFVIAPVNLDPYGIVQKLEHIINLSDERFKYFVDQIAPRLDKEARMNVVMALSATISLNEITKVIRHYVEMTKKTGNLQFALLLQMYSPLLERIAKALLYGAESFVNGWPIGDSIGCMIVAHMVGDSRMKQAERGDDETLYLSKRIAGRKVFIVKAKGPGGRLGKLGKVVEKLVKQNKVAKIITIDAAGKLEGEKTGRIAEGVGVAIGGVGVDRSYIESIAVKRKLPLDSIVIKMSQEEAIQPMLGEVLASIPRVLRTVESRIKETKGRGSVIVVGVGNTCGVGNNKRDAEKAEQLARKVVKIVKVREKKIKELEKKRRWKILFLGE